VDQSGFTLHLFESAPGLQCLTFKNKWIDMPVSSGETAIIPSMQLQFRSLGKLKALCHRVIATRETAQSGRFSAVCFVQLKNTPKYDKEMHGRLQEKIPGFNYKMSPDDFKKFFKNR
jgi:isopenicillin N synthase-like dioxygenase